MTDLLRVFDMNTRTMKASEKKYSGQKYDNDSTTLHFEYTVDFMKVQEAGVTWLPYIIFNVPDDDGNPQVYSFDGYTFVLNWNITSRVTKSRRVEYQLWFVKQTTSIDEETGVETVDDTDYLLSEIDAVVLKPSIPDRPKQRNIIDPEDLDVPPNPPAFVPSVEPSIIGWIELWKSTGIVAPVTQSVDEDGKLVIEFRTYDDSQSYNITLNVPVLDENDKIPYTFLPTGNTANTIPLIKSEIRDGRSLVYSNALGGFVDGSTVVPSSNKTWAELVAMQTAYDPDPSSADFIAEGTVYNCTTEGTYNGDFYKPGTNWIWELVTTNGITIGHWEPLTANVDLSAYQLIANKVTSWSSTVSDDKYPSEKLTKDSLDTKLDDSQLVTSWSGTVSDTNIPSEKLTKDSLDAKLDDTQLVTSWSGTVSDSNIPSEKLTKDTLDAKVDDAQIVTSWSSTVSDTNIPSEKLTKDSLDAKLDDSQLKTSWSSTVSDSNIPSEKLTKDALDTKLDKVTATTTYAQIYAKSTGGNQVMYNLWGDAAIANTVPLRDATTGAIKVGTPSADADATTKKYVDDADALKLDDSQLVTSWSSTVSDTNIPSEKLTKDSIDAVQSDLDTHEARTDNPHSVTKAQVGLGNVDNTSDMDKPVSTAQQTALDAKLDDSQLVTSWSSTVSNTNIPSEKLVKDTLDTKTNKLDQINKVYATNGNSQDIALGYGTSATADLVVQRQANGQVTVPSTPAADTDAASKAFVNSSIGTSTANFLGTLDATTDLGLTVVEDGTTHQILAPTNSDIATALASHTWSTAPTSNDYCFVSINKLSTTDVDEYRRFKYGNSVWSYEYTLNNSSFTQAQWDAINSTINATKVGQYDAYATNKQDKLVGTQTTGQNIKTINNTTLLGTGNIALQTPLTAGTDYQTPLTFDTAPTANSTNPVTSGGVKSALDDKLDDSQLVTSWSSTVSDSNIPSEKLTKDSLDAKLDKVTSSDTYARLYMVNENGAQDVVRYSGDATAYSMAYRVASGVLRVGTPVGNDDATTKAYVDTADSLKSGVYRGTYDDWSAVPSTATYQADANSGTTPLRGDTMVVKDSTAYGSESLVIATTDTSGAHASVSVTYNGSTEDIVYYNVTSTPKTCFDLVQISYDTSSPGGWSAVTLQACTLNGVSYTAGATIANWGYTTTVSYTVVYTSFYSGSWHFCYDGVWATDGKNGWVAEYPLGDVTKAYVDTADATKITGPSSATSNDVVLFDGTTGKLVKDSGKTLGASVPAPSSSVAGQALIVNANGDGLTFGEAGKVDDVQVNGTSVVSNKVASITVDSAPTSSSSNAVSSGGVKTALDAKVAGPSSSTDGNVALFDGTTGKLVKDSGYTIAASVPSGAVFTDKFVQQQRISTDVNRPILLANSNTSEAYTVTSGALCNNSIYANPSTGMISATALTLTGNATVATPTANAHAATKAYVDAADATKLDKVTWEWNKELAVTTGTAGYVLVFDGYMYDSNITIDFDCTTGHTYHGTLLIATQNSTLSEAVVYGDPSGTIVSSIYIVPPTGLTQDEDRRMQVYFVPQGWSKNLVHVRGQGLYGNTQTCPMTFTEGSVPSGATTRPTNALDTKANLSGASFTGAVSTTGDMTTWGNLTCVDFKITNTWHSDSANSYVLVSNGGGTWVRLRTLAEIYADLNAPANATTTAVAPSAAYTNGFWYVTSGSTTGGDANPFLQYHTEQDFRILTTAYNSNWFQQIATDFRSDHVFIRRNTNGQWGDWVELGGGNQITTYPASQ